MRVTMMYCDRCGQMFEKWNHKHKEIVGVVVLDDDGDPYLFSHEDLCPGCYTELETWWNYGKNAESEGKNEKDNSLHANSNRVSWLQK